jgi:glycerol-3-phosphate acyltransferase PlsY
MIESYIQLLFLLLLSFITGSIPTSIILGKIVKGIDIREHGSGNAGGTNVFRVLGWKPALIVVIIDIFKGWLPTAIYATALFKGQSISDVGVLQILCGFTAVLGHTYTIFAGFRGGKGIGTLAGMLIALFPIAFPLCLLAFIITLILTGYVSLSSIMATVTLPIILLIMPILGLQQSSLSLLIFALLIPWFAIFTHRSNIMRLRDGTENRFEKAMIFKKNK